MNEIMLNNTPVTMSSREIAELCNKEHKHVMRDIRAMLEDLELGESKFGSSYISEQNKEIPCFNLDKELTLTLVAGYNTVLRSRIVKRWMELEGDLNNPMKMLRDPATMRSLLLSYTEKVIELESKVEEQKPAVEFVESYVEHGLNMGLTDAWKALGLKPRLFTNFLIEQGILSKRSTVIRAYQQYIDQGYFVMKAHMFGAQVLVTSKGMNWVTKRFENYLVDFKA